MADWLIHSAIPSQVITPATESIMSDASFIQGCSGLQRSMRLRVLHRMQLALIPSITYCAASAASMRPKSRLITFVPVSPRMRIMLGAKSNDTSA